MSYVCISFEACLLNQTWLTGFSDLHSSSIALERKDQHPQETWAGVSTVSQYICDHNEHNQSRWPQA